MTRAANLAASGANMSSTGTLGVTGINATGTPSSTTFLRGDGSWQTPPSNPGTVTSVATGNGLQGGTITSSGTLSIAAPSAGSVGSYAVGTTTSAGAFTSFGSTYSSIYTFNGSAGGGQGTRGGTWMALGSTGGFITWGCTNNSVVVFVRVA